MGTAMDTVTALEETVRTTAGKVGPAVVGIGAGRGSGSGVVVRNGLLLTNAHNLHGDEVAVTFPDGRTGTGSVAGIDVDGDLAVVAVDTADVGGPEWRDDAGVGVGTVVLALANPGGRGLRTTLGFVSAVGQAFRGPRGRRVAGSIEHTAPLPRGSSGGPVVDVEGRLAGINTHRLGDGFYLAVPADTDLRARVEALGRGEAPSRRRLGLALAPPAVARRLRVAVGLPAREGLLVQGVEDASPAHRSGVRRGDLLVEAGGQALRSGDDLFAVLDALSPGESLVLRVVRGAEELSVAVAFDDTREEGSA